MKIKVYLEWINYEGKVQSRELIATFRNKSWAKHFIESISDYNDEFCRVAIE